MLRPSRLIEVSRLEKDPEKLKALYQLGREDAMKNLDQIHAFLSKWSRIGGRMGGQYGSTKI